MNRKLDVGGTLSEVFSTYRENAGVLLPVAFWLFLVVAILNGIAGSSLFLLLLASVVGIAAGTLYQGMVVNLVRDVQDGRRDFSAGELLQLGDALHPAADRGRHPRRARDRHRPDPADRPRPDPADDLGRDRAGDRGREAGVFAAFGRSRELVRGNGWQVFGAIVVAFVIAIIGGLLFAAIAAAIADGPLLRIVFSALASTITAPISALVAAVIYFHLRGFEGVAAPAPAVDPPAPPAV